LKPFPRVSPSSLLDFEGCPKRWHRVRILKDFPFVETEAITYGNIVHEQLEKYVKTGAVLPEHLEYLKPFIDGTRELGYELYAELEVAVNEKWEAVTYWSKQTWLWGKVDLIGIKGDEAIIFDYKTGKRKNDPTQLKMYGVMLFEVLKLRKVTSYYLWLKTKDSDHFEITAENFESSKAEIVERIARMKDHYERQDFPTRTSPLCGWCPCLDTCPEATYYKTKRDRTRR
jgi:RecB family exonuclease